MTKLFESHKSQMDLFMDNQPTKDVHTEHCCGEHGCKYGDEDCPVALKQKIQSYPCPSCCFLINDW